MLVVGDETQNRGFPWATLLLVFANVAVFAAQMFVGDSITYGYSLVPQEITTGEDIVGLVAVPIREPVSDANGTRYVNTTAMITLQPGPRPIYLTIVTSMFLHANWLHLVGNMVFLLVFGRNIERAMKPTLFLIFYLQCGIAAGMTHVYVAPESAAPYLGASGAISGIMGAYFFIFPFNWVKVWMIFAIVDVPSVILIGGWALLQYVGTLAAVRMGAVQTGVAYWAHLGGFVAGVAVVLTLLGTFAVLTLATRKPAE